jgi:signal transduction histidine kinase
MSAHVPKPGDILRKAFPGIPRREAEEMVAIGEMKSYPAGIVLCREGVIEDTFYILLEGEVEVTKVINEEEARFLKYLLPGEFFGEMGLIHNAPRAATVSTTQPTTVLCINKPAFNNFLNLSPSVSMAMVREVSRRLRENDEMAIEDLQLKAGELASAYQRLAQEEFARREFLTSIAHELRTPLTAASGFLEMVRKQLLEGPALDMALETVARNVQQIISLVNDILFLQEVELVLPEKDPVDIGSLVSSAVEQMRESAEKGNIRFYQEIPTNLPKISGHAKSLERALSMVLNNAIKFSPDGGDVHICVNVDDGYVKVSIRDQGVGMPEDAIPFIFDRYFHIEEIGEILFGGLGLGLAITKQVIEQHGGKIEVESKLGEGSKFTICLEVDNFPNENGSQD